MTAFSNFSQWWLPLMPSRNMYFGETKKNNRQRERSTMRNNPYTFPNTDPTRGAIGVELLCPDCCNLIFDNIEYKIASAAKSRS
jgi:hypothetical protein